MTAVAVNGGGGGDSGRRSPWRQQEQPTTTGSGQGWQQWRPPGERPAVTAGAEDNSGRWQLQLTAVAAAVAGASCGSGESGRRR